MPDPMDDLSILQNVLLVVSPVAAAIAAGASWASVLQARRLAREEREWAELQTVRERQVAAANALDDRVLEATRELPPVQGPAHEMAAAYDRVRVALLRARARSTVLEDAEIERRMRALDMALFVEAQHGITLEPSLEGGRSIEPRLNPWPIQVALAELRMALAYFQRGEKPPAAQFPTAEEIVELAHPEGGSVGLDGVRELLAERRVTTAMIGP